jgi:hypothetical protein
MKIRNPRIYLVWLPCAVAACGHSESGAGDTSQQRKFEATVVAAECTPFEVLPVTAPSALITRSGAFGLDYEAWQAFDADDNTMWLSETWQTPAWIAYDWAGRAEQVDRYALTFVNGSLTTRAPKDFTLEGWDGSAWTILDARTEETNWAGRERREYSVAAPGSYLKYRLNVSDDNDARAGVVVVSLGKFELFGSRCDGGGRTDTTELLAEPSSLQLGNVGAGTSFESPFVITTTSATYFRVSTIPADATLHCTDARCLSACNNPQGECRVGGVDFWLTPGDRLPFSLRGTSPTQPGPFSREIRFNYDYPGGTWPLIVPVQGTASASADSTGDACTVTSPGTRREGVGWMAVLALAGIALHHRQAKGQRRR